MLADWVRLGARLVRLLRDQRHSEAREAGLRRLLELARASAARRAARAARPLGIIYPPELPITARREEIVRAIRCHQTVVIAGETGSGKTTQLPKMCLEAGLGIEAMIGCTQPRRVAALSISRRLAEELDVAWGAEVGCKIRFDDRTRPETRVKVMTDGALLAETQSDPLLAHYNALIIDEAHERSLNIDFLLGYLKGLLARRPELRLIITSATIDTAAFSRAFNDAPVIEVSGRLFPVEVVYAPPIPDEEGEITLLDAAARQAERVLCEPGGGDALIFLPGEADIRELCDLLKTRFPGDAELVPLFGRLTTDEQQRAFAPSSRRKLVVATNIAETSLTIPNIRWVIDAGLARLSRYSPRTRTRRLPIEPVSQSSANQRKGRAGRVRDGVCIRLYSEEDFARRLEFTQPEIQRANLAEVILRLKAWRLGEIETFPFLNPPALPAIQAGYELLQELGALDEHRELTPLGRDLARLPIDPALGRMLLQARREGALRELLIIAAGLSIQDPRERPLEHKESAAQAHRRFADPRSDFLSLLNLWNVVQEQWENLPTQSQRRKFCKTNFLSYLRLREWRELHAQLRDGLEQLGLGDPSETPAGYDAIHRGILAGLLGHVAQRTERNTYKTAGNRQVLAFPGSVLYERSAPAAPRRKSGPPGPPRSASPAWIVAGEFVQTSQLFARGLAGIDPLWITELAPHLCRTTLHEPHWSPEAGQVLAEERTVFKGLLLRRRKVAYGNHCPAEAAEIFIRSALIEERLLPEPQTGADREDERVLPRARLALLALDARAAPPARHAFLERNHQLRHKIETWRTRLRQADLPDLETALAAFYARRLGNLSSLHALNRLLGERGQDYLCARAEDLAPGHNLDEVAEAFPDRVEVAGQAVSLSYHYDPGEERDGVTVRLSPGLAHTIPAAPLEWAVPGLREAQAAEFLRALPKSLRRELMPLADKAREMARELQPAGDSLCAAMAAFVKARYGVQVSAEAAPGTASAGHLRPRFDIIAAGARPVASGRDLPALRRQLEAERLRAAEDPEAWRTAERRWERFGLTAWNFGEVPERITINDLGPIYAWPGLELEAGQVNLRLFRAPEAARTASQAGFRRLVELAVQKDLAWLEKDLRGLRALAPLLNGLVPYETLHEQAGDNLRRHLLPADTAGPLREESFSASVARAKARLNGLGFELIKRLTAVLEVRQALARQLGARPAPTPAPGPLRSLDQLVLPPAPAAPGTGFAHLIHKELERLAPANFLELVPFEKLPDLPRYLRALAMRFERGSRNPLADRERAARVAPFQAALERLRAAAGQSPPAPGKAEEFRWMIEEFKVSIFAQELGTAYPISPQRLEHWLAQH